MGAGAAIGAGIQGIQAITSGVQGKQAQRQAQQQQQMANDAFQGMLNQGQQVMGGIQDQLAGLANPQMRQQVLDQALGLGSTLTRNAQAAADQLGQGGGAHMARLAANRGFDFEPTRQNLQLATQTAQESASRARQLAGEQAALAQSNSMQALDAAMAARGFSRNSGAAAAGLAQLQQQNALGRSQLEAQLADQAGQMALGAAQLDTQNLLQAQGQEAQFNLGMNQLGAQTGLQLQQLNDQAAINRAGLLNDAATQGFNALQGTYQQNVLAPQMQLQGLLASLAGQGMGTAGSGLLGVLQGAQGAATEANTGAGNALGGFLGALSQNWTTPASQVFGKQRTSPIGGVGSVGGAGNSPVMRFTP